MHSRPLSRDAHDAMLAEWLRHGLRDRVRIVAVLDEKTCLSCLESDGRVIPLRDAIAGHPLPVDDCTCERGCRCRFRPIVSGCSSNFAKPYEKLRAAKKLERIRALMKSVAAR